MACERFRIGHGVGRAIVGGPRCIFVNLIRSVE